MPIEVGLCGLFRPPIRGNRRKFAHDQPLDVGPRRLFVLGICANVADVWIGQADHLAGVTWVGEYFLISGEARVKYDFPAAASLRPGGAAGEDPPVFERKCGDVAAILRQRSLLMGRTILSKQPQP